MKILVTGSQGFVGKNLITQLENFGYDILKFDRNDTIDKLKQHTKTADFVVHLAGVNRPLDDADFLTGNKGLTELLIECLEHNQRRIPILLSSSVQAKLDNPYGVSKRETENVLIDYSKRNNSSLYIYRFVNLFGKWSKPNYNTVIATWCHNISRGIPLVMNDANVELQLNYIDDVVSEIINAIEGKPSIVEGSMCEVKPIYNVTLGQIHEMLHRFVDSRSDLFIPNMKPGFEAKLYSTYLSFLPKDKFSYPLKMNVDERGSFTEFLKTSDRGQVSINISKPGITKGEHWHHSKNEKFLVVKGHGVIQLRNVFDSEIIEVNVDGNALEVVDIPTGYTHNIINNGEEDMVTVMWVNEPFNPHSPDTYFLKVK